MAYCKKYKLQVLRYRGQKGLQDVHCPKCWGCLLVQNDTIICSKCNKVYISIKVLAAV